VTSQPGFIDKLASAQQKNASLLCVGLDPLPEKIQQYGVSLGEFLRAIVDATADLVCAFKPQHAHFAALAAEDELQDIIGARVRAIVGDMPLLIPGIGAQGGDLRQTLKYGLTAEGAGLVLSASRSVLYAGDSPGNFAEKARLAAEAIKLAAQDIVA